MNTFKLLFEKQIYNYLGLLILLALAACLTNFAGGWTGALWGLGSTDWFWMSIIVVIVHQMYAWFAWRTELHLRLMSRWFGRQAFGVWGVFFVILLILRFSLIFLVGYANRATLGLHPALAWGLLAAILIPAGYTIYSIKKYFGVKRGLGIDHFDPAYRQLGLVRQGIFRYTANAMYLFGALLFWVPALLFDSAAALLAAFFSHAALWVHYYTLELPDMKRIYSVK